jgi:hypothetical protein
VTEDVVETIAHVSMAVVMDTIDRVTTIIEVVPGTRMIEIEEEMKGAEMITDATTTDVTTTDVKSIDATTSTVATTIIVERLAAADPLELDTKVIGDK